MTRRSDTNVPLYQTHALDWAAARQTLGTEALWLDRFTAQLAPNATVLDIGCGHGLPILKHLTDMGFRTTGLDAAPALIDLALAHVPMAPFHIADMRQMDLDQSFDGLLAWDSLFHLPAPDQRAMFPILAKHAAPDSVLMFTSGPEAGETWGQFAGHPLYHASLSTAEYRALLHTHGFNVLKHISQDPDCGGHTVWLARRNG